MAGQLRVGIKLSQDAPIESYRAIRRSVQVPAGPDPAELVDRVLGFAEAGFTEIILMLSGGSMTTNADPTKTAAMLAEKVLPQLPS